MTKDKDKKENSNAAIKIKCSNCGNTATLTKDRVCSACEVKCAYELL